GTAADMLIFVENSSGGTYSFNGNGGIDTVVGADLANTWTLTGANQGSLNTDVSFTGVENLIGGAAADNFISGTSASISASIDGGVGSDTLKGPDGASEWHITGANSGKLDATSFTSIEKLVGGNANDVFKVETGGSIASVDGGPVDAGSPSSDSLDFSSLAAA